MHYKELLLKKEVLPYLLKARFGVEREVQRATFNGTLATTAHPKKLGNRSFHPSIQTDFAETQLEFITPVFHTTRECVRYLEALHDVAIRSMPDDELLWNTSMPPLLPEKEADIHIANLQEKEVAYREYLVKVYGKRKQMLSGVHFNFEFSHELLEKMWTYSGKEQSLLTLKSELYMKLSRQYLRYQWLITYLFGATPHSFRRLIPEMDTRTSPVRSLRNSNLGYKNNENVRVSYDSYAQYLQDLETLVSSGLLIDAKEYYSPIRLRGGTNVRDLAKEGIHYVELRNLDASPFSRTGVTQKMLDFLHLFCLYLIYEDEGEQSIEEGQLQNNQVALEHPHSSCYLVEEGLLFFEKFLTFVSSANLSHEWVSLVNHYKNFLKNPTQTPSGKLIKKEQENPQFILELSQQFAHKARRLNFQLQGYTNMELSTQNLLFDALQSGVSVRILDEAEQLIELTYKGKTELVKNANMTAHDTLLHYFLLDNKIVCKKLLQEADFQTPGGAHFSTKEEAESAFLNFKGKRIVIKPKSTNFGLGISIFQTQPTKKQFDEAVSLAFKEDDEILIEEFVDGCEYRFFVIDGETKAVLSRIGANVTGDGKHTIEELVQLKNAHPFRGEKNRYPLVRIQLGEIERLQLELQGRTPESVPKKGEQITLRENSNISTGGDSIDMSDIMHPSYKELAGKIAQLFQVHIAGIDLIVKDCTKPLTKENYAVIEVNYNPMMSMHLYPYKSHGTPRRLTQDVLKFLFPELL